MTKLTSTGAAATENFDSLATSGTGSTLPEGWYFSESGTNANATYTAGTGSGTAGETYSFGAAGSTERAFGMLQSGALVPTIGAKITNETGQDLTSVLIAYTGEQWRLGATGRTDRLDFQISYDATSLTTGTWTDVDALDFASLNTSTAGALDGNAAANRSNISGTVTLDQAVANGGTFWIRWTDFNATSSDDGLAIDNFSITGNPTPPVPTPGTFSIAGGSAAEGAGFVELKVTRAGGSAGAATLDYLVSAGTASADDFVGGAMPQGQITFADGQTEAAIKVAVVNDSVNEADETFTVTLANPTAGAIGTAAATGKILNDDAQQVAIFDIQGEAHKSTYAGQSVTTTGVVTAVASNGFYLQDKTGDGKASTSDAIFVFTTTAPSVQVGNEATVTGKVEEFLPGNSTVNLSTTEIVATATSVAKDTGGVALVHALPDAVVIGTGGLLPLTDVFDDDQFAVYDPQNDAADFFESLEGMRVTVDAPIVVDRTNSFGETYVVASGGAGATGLNDRGGMTISGNANGFDDYNPERIQLDNSSLSDFNGKYTQGDELSGVTGIISYDFQSYELLVTGAVTVTQDAPEPAREVTTLVGDATHLTMATYNVENLDPGDDKFDILASDIVYQLRAPDVIALQEIQDADGAGTGSDLSGYVTAQGLIDAIKAIGGPDYVYVEITPSTAGTTGGEPGGNIRNGFLYNPGRVDYVEGSAELITGTAFTNSRNPLAATFEFNGEEITAISVHSSSRGGSDPLFGATQPPVNGAEAARIAQSEAIRDYVEDLIGADTEARVAVLGDFNGFYFEQSLELLEAGGLLTNLHRTLPEEERYSYVFGSNAQALDNFLVSSTLYQNAQFDAVHINAEQADTAARGTDHDPLVASFEITGETPLTVDLSQYVRVGRYDLPTAANTSAPAGSQLALEASAITYNWDKDTLFVVGDGTTSIVEISKTGQLIGSMTLAAGAFDDIEGLAYVGDGKFVMVEERTRSVVSFEYTAGGSLVRADTQVVQLGTTTGNVGLEGVTYDPETGGYVFVKESNPQGIFQSNVDFVAGTATNGSASTENATNLFDPAKLALGDMADVFALSNLSTIGTSERGNILVLSQESGKILEVDRLGNILSSLTIVGDAGNDAIAQQHEGIAMDKEGNLYVVSENGGGDASHPQLWVYKASDVPNAAPTAIALANVSTELPENTSTATRLKVADITVTDDQLGTNVLSVTGADAQYFEVDATGLYIKAGTVLDYETKSSFSVTVQVDDPSLGGAPDAAVSYTLALKDVVNEGSVKAGLYVSEVAPWSSGNSPVGADWFEVTNGGTTAVNIAGWKVDDSSKAFSSAVALNGVTSIGAGESVIFIETSTPATTIQAFINTWFGGVKPAGLQIGTYSGSGIGLSTDGDAVNLYDTTGAVQASVTFGAAPKGPYATFDNTAGLDNAAITTLSAVGANGAFQALNDVNEIGSPGDTLNKGTVADGYLKGATVFIDVNGNGVRDASEPFTTTDSEGKFTLFSGVSGPILAVGGVNADTDLPNNLVLSAPEGASVINPLTTLIQTLVVSGQSLQAAEAAVKQAFGLDAGLALTQVDLIAAATPGSPAFAAQQAAASVAEVLNTVQDNQGDIGDALAALAELALSGQPVDLTNAEILAEVLGAGLPDAAPALLEQLVAETQDVTEAIDQAQDLGDITQVQENEAPVAIDDALTIAADATTGNLWSQLLANDTDPDGASTLRIKEINAATTLGTVVFNAATQSLTYAAGDDAFDAIASGGSLTDSFSYTVTDEYGATDIATVNITVTKPNTAPTDLVISNAAVAENKGAGEVVGTLSAKDSLGDKLTYSLTDTAGGRFTVDAATGVVTATQAFDYETDKSFQITARIEDRGKLYVEKTIDIAVTNVNEAPTAKADLIGIDEDATSANLWSQLIGNDLDPEGIATLSISAVNTGGTKGTVQFDPIAKTLFYVADDESFDELDNGAKAGDSFSYTVTDGTSTSTATVQVSVTGVADGAIRLGTVRADTLTGTSGEDLIGGLIGNDTLYGVDGNDKLWGGIGKDKLFGGNGNDTLSGDLGEDELDGGAGDDMLFGDTGDDRLTGGAGRDTFGFSLFGGKDTITDFNVAEDRLMLGFGVSVSKTKVSDVNGDGKQDLTLTLGLLGLNGTVTLLGVKDYSLVQIDRGDTFISQSPF